MTHTINPIVTDLSHWDPAHDYPAAKAAGLVGVIYKATEGTSYTDSTYVEQQHAAKAAGLKWGAYHFANSQNVQAQINNFMKFAAPDPDELFCLDWEDNGSDTMSSSQAQEWITGVEADLKRPGQCVVYSGNTAKDQLGHSVNQFFGSRRLWLAQYGTNPVVQASWGTFWLWQYTDGHSGPAPHTLPGLDPGGVDMNSFDGQTDKLIAEWATGGSAPQPALSPIPPETATVNVIITAPPGVTVNVLKLSGRSG